MKKINNLFSKWFASQAKWIQILLCSMPFWFIALLWIPSSLQENIFLVILLSFGIAVCMFVLAVFILKKFIESIKNGHFIGFVFGALSIICLLVVILLYFSSNEEVIVLKDLFGVETNSPVVISVRHILMTIFILFSFLFSFISEITHILINNKTLGKSQNQ